MSKGFTKANKHVFLDTISVIKMFSDTTDTNTICRIFQKCINNIRFLENSGYLTSQSAEDNVQTVQFSARASQNEFSIVSLPSKPYKHSKIGQRIGQKPRAYVKASYKN